MPGSGSVRERERLRGCENMGATEEEGRGREKNKKGTYGCVCVCVCVCVFECGGGSFRGSRYGLVQNITFWMEEKD